MAHHCGDNVAVYGGWNGDALANAYDVIRQCARAKNGPSPEAFGASMRDNPTWRAIAKDADEIIGLTLRIVNGLEGPHDDGRDAFGLPPITGDAA